MLEDSSLCFKQIAVVCHGKIQGARGKVHEERFKKQGTRRKAQGTTGDGQGKGSRLKVVVFGIG